MKKNYPDQFYNCPQHFKGGWKIVFYIAQIITAIANEIHHMRCDIEKVHKLNETEQK